MGASAYAVGDHIAFTGTPDLSTAAHEATHVVQQRAGVDLPEGPVAGQTAEVVRHRLKAAHREAIVERLSGVGADGARIEGVAEPLERGLRERYGSLPWDTDFEDAYRRARHLEFLNQTNGLNGADRGNLYEVFDRRVYRAGQDVVAHPEVPLQLADQTSRRVPDNLIFLERPRGDQPGRVIIHDDKCYTGPLSDHAVRQIEDYRRLLGERSGVTVVVEGKRMRVVVQQVLITIPEPSGMSANLHQIQRLTRLDDRLQFEIFNVNGASRIVGADELASRSDKEEVLQWLKT